MKISAIRRKGNQGKSEKRLSNRIYQQKSKFDDQYFCFFFFQKFQLLICDVNTTNSEGYGNQKKELIKENLKSAQTKLAFIEKIAKTQRNRRT